ncbi:MAG: hypothetical protein OEZ05_14715, partial [Nitrospirota bacterium]|nr:hypothetical protein [Nitrospirota bacterium]
PQDPRGRYQTIQIIIFSDPTWTEPDTFQRYVSGENETALTSVDQDFRQQFEASVRAGYHADESGQAGWIGPWNRSQSTDRTLTMQWIFQDP